MDTHTSSLVPLDLALRAAQACQARADAGNHPGQGETHGYRHRKNVGANRVSITIERLRELDPALAIEMVALASELGYSALV